MGERVEVRSGVGFTGLLALVFVTLKLAGIGPVASWSWLWVLSPLWLPVVCLIGFLLLLWAFASLVSR